MFLAMNLNLAPNNSIFHLAEMDAFQNNPVLLTRLVNNKNIKRKNHVCSECRDEISFSHLKLIGSER